MKKKYILQELGWATAQFPGLVTIQQTVSLHNRHGRQGMGHDTTRARPQHGRACATIRHSVRAIQPSARAGVAWLAECVAIQRLYRDLGRHCVAIGAAIRRRMNHDTVLCACNTA